MREMKCWLWGVWCSTAFMLAFATGCVRCEKEIRVHFEENKDKGSTLVYSYYIGDDEKALKHGELYYWDSRAGTLLQAKYRHGDELSSELTIIDPAHGP
ncbi:MAG TPA: hypothetical protein DCZ95_16915 [Verrucomicrobia bacterium]|nr:MAG: hypothetical protein A2X46_09405 [Lentisphaerae bacterium GWF2_57_35]HBA85766.1 hypothetical protein [Verrucomicrobiota bacterium]